MTGECQAEQWYVVQTKPRQESTATEHLLRQHYQTYCPQVRQKRRRRGRWIEGVEPLFPRYLFIRTDPETCDISPIRSTRGVIGLVRFGQRLVPVPDQVVEAVLCAEDAEGYIPLGPKELYRKGDKVRILEGPLAGLEAVFESDAGQRRALILMDVLGKLGRVYIEKDLLGPLS